MTMKRTDSLYRSLLPETEAPAAEAPTAAERAREELREEQRAEAQACEQAKTVTQLTPDDVLADDGAMAATHGDEAPTEREMEQDVMTINPSVESMESRG